MKKLIFGLLFLGNVAYAEDKKNIFSITFGYGANNKVNVSNGPVATAEAQKGILAGMQYQRIVAEEVVLGGSFLINGTVLGSVGLRF